MWKGEPASVSYRPFYLNPGIPPEGYDFISYMEKKFAGRLSLQQAFEGPQRMGAAVGLVFNMDKIRKAPNTTLSHCLIALAPEEAREAVIDDVYAAYFEHGQDIGDLETLVQIGASHGMGADDVRGGLKDPALQAQIQAEVQEAYGLGISGVPFFVINHQYAFSGAQAPEVILNVLKQVSQAGGGA